MIALALGLALSFMRALDEGEQTKFQKYPTVTYQEFNDWYKRLDRKQKKVSGLGEYFDVQYEIELLAGAVRKSEKAFESLVPHKHLQERTLNVTTYLNRYGLYFVDWIYDAIDLDDKAHRVIYL